MKSIKIFIMLVLVLSLVSSFALISNADDEPYNIARMVGANYHWSGTWPNPNPDNIEGDPGFRCFDGTVNAEGTNKWGSADLNAADQWISVEFEGTRTVTGFKICQANTPWTNNQGFDIEYQNGTDEWKKAVSVTAEDLGITDGSKWAEYVYTFSEKIELTAFRVYVPTSMIGAGVSAVELAEIEVYSDVKPSAAPAGLVNLATMEGATHHWSGTWGDQTDDVWSGNVGEFCFNGYVSGEQDKWGSAEVTDAEPQYLAVKFPAAQQVNGFRVWQANTPWTNIQGFEVQYQNGTDEWHTALVVDSTAFTPDPTKYKNNWFDYAATFDAPITATAIRLYFTSAVRGDATAVELAEFEIYGTVGSSTPSDPETGDYGFVLVAVIAVSALFATTAIAKRKNEI